MTRSAAARDRSRGYWVALSAAVLVGAGLRAFRLGAQVIIDDEWHALNVVHDFGFGFIFGHFGTADHSIPLALYFELLSRTVGLSEWSMRMPSLVAGIAAIALVPLALKPWLSRTETALLAWLLALSPLLINFSRTARPYAFIALMLGVALPLAWRWWRDGGHARAAGWIGGAALAAWLNPLTIVIGGAPLLAFGADAVASGRRGDWRGFRRVLLAGIALTLPVLALLAVPIANDAVSLATKAATHAASPGTAAVALSLFAGSGSAIVTALVVAAAAAGWFELNRRDRDFARFVLLIAAVAVACVLITGAAWIRHGLVLARYLIGLAPLFLALAAIGFCTGINALRARAGLPRATTALACAIAAAVAFALGPVPGWYRDYDQFTGHLSYQFDYQPERNPIVALLDPVPVEPFYREIALAHPEGDALVVEAPWHLETFWNPLHRYQRVHRQRLAIGFVNGVCAPRFYGELDPATPGLQFANFVYLADLLAGRVRADYLVLHRASVPGARELPVEIEACISAARARFGAPWRETPTAVVFRTS